MGIQDQRLRFFTPEGHIVLMPEEAARAEQQRAIQAEARNELLAAKLRELGIDPGTL